MCSTVLYAVSEEWSTFYHLNQKLISSSQFVVKEQVKNVWSEAENGSDSEYSMVQLVVMNIQEIIPVVKSLINQMPFNTSSSEWSCNALEMK